MNFNFIASLLLQQFVLAILFSSRAAVLALRANGMTKTQSRQKSVDDIALKIGLNVVPKKKTIPRKDNEISFQDRTSKKRPKRNMPTIQWGENAKQFFWGRNQHDNNSNIQLIENDQGFPLYRVKNVLTTMSLKRMTSLLLSDRPEELEQHEMVDGKPRILRRSLVSRLIHSPDMTISTINEENSIDKLKKRDREIIELVLAGLPNELVEGLKAQEKTNIDHPYEDGSIVYYRNHDFYYSHHDSYAPDEPLREKQRAYTILLYLRLPSSGGGTAFPRLTMGQQRQPEIVIKPNEGDALVWPNFDEEGKPCMDSVHRALAIPSQRNGDGNSGDCQDYDDITGKVVINLWFQGRLKKL